MQAAAALAAFNLVCQTQFADPRPAREPPYTVTYRVNPLLGRFCTESCRTTEPIAALSASEIVFAMDGGDFVGPFRTIVRIQLASGAYRQTDTRNGLPFMSMVGRCERAPFSGFRPESLTTATPLIVQVPTVFDEARPGASPR